MSCVFVFLLLLAALTTNKCVSAERSISAEKSLIWGPGLDHHIHLPVHYVYIQAVDEHGNNFTVSPGKDAFQVYLDQGDEDRMRVQQELLDMNNGRFLFRYRLRNSYDMIALTVQLKNGDYVGDSPYMIDFLMEEDCYCPRDRKEWFETHQCPQHEPQIDQDLEPFPKIHLEAFRNDVFHKHSHRHFAHYTIMKNKVYRRTVGTITDFKMFSDEILLSVTRKVRIPDVEFVVNLGDWPIESMAGNDKPLPVLSWCGSNDTYDIILPTYDLTSSTLGAMTKVSLDIMSVQGHTGPKWEDKKPKAFFRGRDSRQERLDLVKNHRNNTDMFDVGLTNFFFFEYDEQLYGPKHKAISFFDFFNYKYQLNIDGTVAAYRLPYLLAGDSLVIKQDSPYYEHFYSQLEPWVHYVPMSRDLGDVEERVQWARDHDGEARQIGRNAQEFVRENLMPKETYCYIARLLTEYSKRQQGRPKKHTDMVLLQQPEKTCRTCKEMKQYIKSKHDEL